MFNRITIGCFLAILFASFLHAGWGADTRLTSNNGSSENPCAALSGLYLHVVWQDNTGGDCEIYYRRSTNGGSSWQSIQYLTDNTGQSLRPFIVASGSYVHLVWQDNTDGDYDIYYKRSTDNGANWSKGEKLTDDSYADEYACITLSGADVHVVWYSTVLFGSIYYKRSTNNGSDWQSRVRLDASYHHPYAAANGSFIHALYNAGDADIWYKRSTNTGADWQTAIALSENDNILYPCVGVTGSYVHAFWSNCYFPGYMEINYRRSTDNGANWGTETQLTSTDYYCYRPRVAVAGSYLHLIWFDNRDTNWEIYYKRSSNDGTTWGPDTRLTNNSAASVCPFVTGTNNTAHVVWSDNRDGNCEIYYKRGYFSVVDPEDISLDNVPTPVSNSTCAIFERNKIRILLNPSRIEEALQIALYDVLGRVILVKTLTASSSNVTLEDYSLKVLPMGVYLLTIKSNDREIETIKAVKHE